MSIVKKYQHMVQCWQKLASEGISLKLLQEIVGISRAIYYRYRKILKKLVQKDFKKTSTERF